MFVDQQHISLYVDEKVATHYLYYQSLELSGLIIELFSVVSQSMVQFCCSTRVRRRLTGFPGPEPDFRQAQLHQATGTLHLASRFSNNQLSIEMALTLLSTSFRQRGRLWPRPKLVLSPKRLRLPGAGPRLERPFSTGTILQHKQSPDVLIVGSGAAALTAALRAKHYNLKPLVIEKSPLVGGTTCYSGGALWIPNSGVHPANVSDSFAEALKYMQNTIDVSPTKSSSLNRKTAFLENGPKMVQFLQERGFKWRPSVGYPDYYPLVEGGKSSGRSIEGAMFDLNKLGEWKHRIRMTTRSPLYPMHTLEAGAMYRSMSGDVRAFLTAAKVTGLRMWTQKLLGRAPVTMGMSLVAQLLHLCLKNGVEIEVECVLKELVMQKGRVTGAVVIKNCKEQLIEAKEGVILAAGGFSRNADMRKRYQSPEGAASKTLTNPVDMGDAISAAANIGAAEELMDEAWWGPTLIDRNGKPYWCQFERGLPHSIVVDAEGNRFLNEAESYTRFIHNLFAHHKRTGLGDPAYLIIDSQHRERYVFSGMLPGKVAQWALDSGLLVQADTLEGLAQELGIDATGLVETVKRFNNFVSRGVDEDFHRGRSPYDKFFGEPHYKLNPNLGSLSKPPFYGGKLVPGDLGTKGGVLTDERARALKDDGSVIKGLYAVGNSSASVMGKDYIGAGSTLGPALTFAFVSVNDIANKD